MRTGMLLPIFLAAIATQAEAQTEPRVHLGANFLVAEPQQEFSNYVNTSFGGSLNTLWAPRPQSAVGIRFEGGAIGYGNESKRVPFSSRLNRVQVEQTTSNFIAFVNVGPQLTLKRGAVHPYIAPSVGVTYIATVSSLHGDGDEAFASDTHQNDAKLSLGATGGVYVPVLRGRIPVALDLSTRYTRNGMASYLVEGSIEDNPDGSISFDPIRSRANLLTFHVGVSVGIVDHKKKPE